MPGPVTIRRNAVHAQVWAQPMGEVASSYGLSGTALARICRYLEIPTPPRWHWSRYGRGQILALPSASTGITEEIVLADLTVPDHRFGMLSPRPPVPQVTVATAPREPHPLVVSTGHILRGAAQVPDAVIHLVDQALLDLRVSSASLERGLRLMDALVTAIEARGHRGEVRTKPPHSAGRYGSHASSDIEWASSVIRIDDGTIPFCITEGHNRVALPPDPQPPKRRRTTHWEPPPQVRYREEPTGILSLHLPGTGNGDRIQRNWNDGGRQRLESCLHHVLTSAEHLAANQEIERLERERSVAAKAEAERRAAEAERRRQHERHRVHDLDSRVHEWEASASIRAFVAAVEADAIGATGTPVPPESELAHWLTWARQRASTLQEQAIRTVLQLREVPAEQRERTSPYPSDPFSPRSYWETRNWWNR